MVTGRYRAGNALAAVVGALALAALTLIPLVGDLLLYALALLGTGAAILALLSRRRTLPTHPSYEAYVRGPRGRLTARRDALPGFGDQEAFCPFTASCSSGIME
jgi:hypothetical protein